jgi:glyoxylase-like metal-dependent hydrolase (beta-lactamase superfamily II)
VIHERELEYCRQLFWPEFADAFMGIIEVDAISGPKRLSKHVRVIETFGHTLGSISVLAEAEDGLVACIGDAVIVREDYTEFRAPSVVTVTIAPEVSVASLKRVAALAPALVIPGYEAPFRPGAEKGL